MTLTAAESSKEKQEKGKELLQMDTALYWNQVPILANFLIILNF